MPMLPPTSVGMFAVFKMCATSDVVVVLPFEPVMATSLPRRKRQASSISLHTGMPFLRASFQRRKIRRHARTDHDQVLLEEIAATMSAKFQLHSGGAELRSGFGQLGFRALVRGGDRRAVARTE